MHNLKYVIQQLKKSFINYHTEQLTFRHFTKSDIFPLFEATKNKEFNTKLWWNINNQDDLMIEALKLIREHDMDQSVVISACEKITGKWVGLIKFTIYKDSITMSLWLHPDYWNSRIPIRCAESAIEIVFQNTQLSHIYARITKDYPTMEKMVTLNKFKWFEETQVQHTQGHIVQSNTFRLLKEDWNRKTQICIY